MKIIYAGTPEFSVKPLEKILQNGYEVVAVLTQTDKPCGRKGILTAPPLKTFALSKGLTVLQYEKLRDNADELKKIGASLMVTCAYGQILTDEILNIFPLGVYNIHASLLPKHRGASPIQQSLLCGDKLAGVTVMKTERGLDTGDILLAKSIAIEDGDDLASLSEKLSELGAECIIESLELLMAGNARLTKQDDSLATVCKKVSKADGKIDFSKSYAQISRLVRAFSPYPAAYAECGTVAYNVYKVSFVEASAGECGIVLYADRAHGLVIKCADGAVKIEEIQAAGGKRLKANDFINGNKIKPMQKFGE